MSEEESEEVENGKVEGEAEVIEETANNTDRVLWLKDEDNPFSDGIHITEDGRISIAHNCLTIILPFETWFELGLASTAVPMEGYWLDELHYLPGQMDIPKLAGGGRYLSCGTKPSFWQRLVRWWKR